MSLPSGDYTPPGTYESFVPAVVTGPTPAEQDPMIGGGAPVPTNQGTTSPPDPNRRQLSLNAVLSYTGSVANNLYRTRVIQVTHEVHPVFEQGEARHRRAFYPHSATVGRFAITIASIGYQEKERLLRWIASYVEGMLNSDTIGGGRGFPVMDILVPGLKFHRKGIPLSGSNFGDHQGAMVWNTTILFEPAEDPYDANVINTFPSEFVGQNAFDVDKEKNSSYFYPQAPHIVNWAAPDEYEKLTDIGKLEDILSQRLPFPPHIQNTGWPTSAGPFGTGGRIAWSSGGTGGGGTGSTTTTPGSPTTPGTITPGVTVDMKTIFQDSSSVACDPRTTDRGVVDGYHSGQKIRIRICEVPLIPGAGDGGSGHATVNARISTVMYNMAAAARANGVQLRSNSSFRTMSHQTQLYNAPHSAPVARPGYSNHQMGMAIDYANAQKGGAVWNWMAAHARSYHIINLPSEYWHWSIDGG